MARADVAIMRVPALRVRQRKIVSKIRQLAVASRPAHEVPVIRHQAIGQQTHSRHVLERLGQNTLEGLVIAYLLKKRHPPIGPVEDMVNVAAQRNSPWSSHGESLASGHTAVKTKRFLTPFTAWTPSVGMRLPSSDALK